LDVIVGWVELAKSLFSHYIVIKPSRWLVEDHCLLLPTKTNTKNTDKKEEKELKNKNRPRKAVCISVAFDKKEDKKLNVPTDKMSLDDDMRYVKSAIGEADIITIDLL